MTLLKDIAGSFKNKRGGFENYFKFTMNVLFVIIIILYNMKKIESKNLLESVA